MSFGSEPGDHRPPHRRRTAMPSSATISQQPVTNVIVRQATAEDADRCAEVFYDAFESIAVRHSFPVEPPSREFTRFKVAQMLSGHGFAGLVAERNGRLL